uniref:Proline-rich protein HaeIII subfamily 1-like n=1 Tax=Castor canadensis TaxID=51338 RepID=A0A8B7VZK5_CASCN|nr:proline-rich protein HaeIII subfamily 1-like [Castor canadensis]
MENGLTALCSPRPHAQGSIHCRGMQQGNRGGVSSKQDPVFEQRTGPLSAAGQGMGASHGASARFHQGPAPGIPLRLPRPPAAPARTQPRSLPPARVRPVPAHLPRRSCGRARVPVVPGRSWRQPAGCGPESGRRERRERGPERRESGRGPGRGRGPPPRRRPPLSAGRTAAPSSKAGLPGLAAMGGSRRRQRQRQRRTPQAGGARPTAPDGPGGQARPRASWGAVARQRPARPPIPRCPFFPGRARGSMPGPGLGQRRVKPRGVERPLLWGRAPLPC